jgi:hypothetical protein
MKHIVIWGAVVGGLLVAANELMIATPNRVGQTYVGSTEDRVRQLFVSYGWTDVQVARHGRLLLATASKDGQTRTIVVDLRTGRLFTQKGNIDDQKTERPTSLTDLPAPEPGEAVLY